jgi:hypothetical protein
MKHLESVLSPAEADFVRRVVMSPGAKLNGGEAWGITTEEHTSPLWEKPEELGLIECVGSYKWIPTDKLEIGIVEVESTARLPLPNGTLLTS